MPGPLPRGLWFGPDDAPLAGWLTVPETGPSDHGVVVVPPLAYEHVTAHHTLRALAEALAAKGWATLRYHPRGTGDSGGPSQTDNQVDTWLEDVGLAVDEMLRLGCRDVVLLGLRLGANIALRRAGHLPVSRIVAWLPIVSLSRFARRLKLLATPDALAGDGIAVAGVPIPASTLAQLGELDLQGAKAPPGASVLLIHRPADDPAAAAEPLADAGWSVETAEGDGAVQFLDQPAEYATVADGEVEQVTRWIAGIGRPAPVGAGGLVTAPTRRAIPWDGDTVTEEFLTLVPDRLNAVVTEPVPATADPGPAQVGTTPEPVTLLWLDPGSETHVGPGRAWVELARTLALSGHRSVRMDFTGWGESAHTGRGPGRPYDHQARDDLRDAVAALHASGHGRVVPVGLCAGAWTALRMAPELSVAGVIAFNPQLYWQPGDPVESSIELETRPRRAEEIASFHAGWEEGRWDREDADGTPHPAAQWLRDLRASEVPLLFVFADGDDGLIFLQDRVNRAWGDTLTGRTTCTVLPRADHALFRLRYRAEALKAISGWLHAASAAEHPAGP